MSRTIWRMSATSDIQLNGVIDRSFYYRYKSSGSIWISPEPQVQNRNIRPSNELRKLHHKVLIIDGAHPDPADRVVVTGSYNFSKNAEYSNDENLLIIYSDRHANQYYQYFAGVVNRAEGKSNPPATIQTVIPWSTLPMRRLITWNGMLRGNSVRLSGVRGNKLKAHTEYGAFSAYVMVRDRDEITFLNKKLLENGIGTYFEEGHHPDSAAHFKQYEQQARQSNKGLWQHPENIGTYVRSVQ